MLTLVLCTSNSAYFFLFWLIFVFSYTFNLTFLYHIKYEKKICIKFKIKNWECVRHTQIE